jgi:leucyl-tRNA synthetase
MPILHAEDREPQEGRALFSPYPKRMPDAYDFRAIERKWQERWENERTFRAGRFPERPKYYVLEMLPYPSGDLHVGHAKNYTLGDAIARMTRMLGYDVLHPMGWDAFGLPAENAAIQRRVDPASWTQSNIANMQRQVRLMGTSYDWSREIVTCKPEYYRWNQWLFLRLYESGLAYKREAPVNWCPTDKTVLANEQVIDGRCWRDGTLVERRNLAQWFLKITDYADRLVRDLDRLDGWPERTRTMQRNWIGRSEGVQLSFAVDRTVASIDVFTTRADTLFGVTFLAIAPEHHVVETLKGIVSKKHTAQIDAFALSLRSKSELERTSLMEKDGIFTGAYAVNPLSHERVPIWVTNYVLAEYGTGAVMGVPAHDERDFDFARKHGLPIAQVIVPKGAPGDAPLEEAFVDDGRLIASGDFTGMSSVRARDAIAQRLGEVGAGHPSVNYRVRDWLISRQRYWGTPIPIIDCERCGEVPIPESDLPVLLPPNPPISGQGSPLAMMPEFVNVNCPRCDGPARRETDTMDTFFESSWYYLRYLSPHDALAPWNKDDAARWMNVDQYIGGAEHAVLHLLYSRFFYKFFHDRGWVGGDDEPFARLFHQGFVLHDGEKMSKSRGNVVGIDETAKKNGVDAMRLFLLYVTPPEDTSDWTDEGISGRVRFINRLWRICTSSHSERARMNRTANHFRNPLPPVETHEEKQVVRAVHVAAKSALEETMSRRFHYNTTIARFDELLNATSALQQSDSQSPALVYAIEAIPILIAPFAPHIAEELWERSGHATSVHLESYFEPDDSVIALEEITLVVQVNGKIRARIRAEPGLSESAALALALAEPNVRAQLNGNEPRKHFYVRDKLINLVV